MTDRLLTVITPFYNSTEFMDFPLNSVLYQTYQNWEYICVDDCSTDGTLEKLQEYAAKDPCIKVIASLHGGQTPCETKTDSVSFSVEENKNINTFQSPERGFFITK